MYRAINHALNVKSTVSKEAAIEATILNPIHVEELVARLACKKACCLASVAQRVH